MDTEKHTDIYEIRIYLTRLDANYAGIKQSLEEIRNSLNTFATKDLLKQYQLTSFCDLSREKCKRECNNFAKKSDLWKFGGIVVTGVILLWGFLQATAPLWNQLLK